MSGYSAVTERLQSGNRVVTQRAALTFLTGFRARGSCCAVPRERRNGGGTTRLQRGYTAHSGDFIKRVQSLLQLLRRAK